MCSPNTKLQTFRRLIWLSVTYKIESRAEDRKEEGIFKCLKEIVGKGSGDILDFNMNISYQSFSKTGNPLEHVIAGAGNQVTVYEHLENVYVYKLSARFTRDGDPRGQIGNDTISNLAS